MKRCPQCQTEYEDDISFCLEHGVELAHQPVWSEGAELRGKYRIVKSLNTSAKSVWFKWFNDYEAKRLRDAEPRLLRAALHLDPGSTFAERIAQYPEDSTAVTEFKQEYGRLLRLQHPGAQRVEAVEEAPDHRPFVVFEETPGQTVRQALKSGPMPAPHVISIAWQIASTLEAAHQLGLYHGNLRAEKVVLIHTARGERTKVLDFGSSHLTSLHVSRVLQDPDLLPPHPWRAGLGLAVFNSGDAAAQIRSDLSMLGILMYEMLTGTLPFDPESFENQHNHAKLINDSHPALRINPKLDGLVRMLREDDLQLRPAHMQAVAEELDRLRKQVKAG